MPNKLPIVFSPQYDIRFFGLQRLHPFDSEKYGKVFENLQKAGILKKGQEYVPEPVTDEILLEIHTPHYLKLLQQSKIVAAIAEQSWAKWFPNWILQRKLLRPMRYGTGGTLLAGELAVKYGWAINLAGGYHHTKAHISSGFCFYADISLVAYRLLKNHQQIKKIMVVDLDAHQGNGFEAIFKDDPAIVTLDVYNGQIYPNDFEAKSFIKYDYPLASGTTSKKYMELIRRVVPRAIALEKPDFVIYNAGTDIYERDPLGGLRVTAEDIIARDELLFETCLHSNIPILMLLSGGYTQESSTIIAESIRHQFNKFELENYKPKP